MLAKCPLDQLIMAGMIQQYKIRPVMKSILQKCLSLYNPHRENSIDDAMVGFKGRSSLKQYMSNKPTKRGYKIWCRCDSRMDILAAFKYTLVK